MKDLLVSFFKFIYFCLLYTSDAADDMQCVDLGGRRIIKKIVEGLAGGGDGRGRGGAFFKQKTAYEM